MGKGAILSGGSDGLYQVQVKYNRTWLTAKLAQLDAQIASLEVRITELESQIAGETDNKKRAELETKKKAIELQLAAIRKSKAYYQAIPADPQIEAWCADLTEDLSGDVATIELGGQYAAGKVLVRPGYEGRATWSAARDGQLMHIKCMGDAAAFYSMAMAPGWQKWMPTYRVGELKGKDGDTAEVWLDPLITQYHRESSLNVTGTDKLSGIAIEYMDCNGEAFDVGDRVVVEYRSRSAKDAETPVVIGFESHPKPCEVERFLRFATIEGRFIKLWDDSGACLETRSIDTLVNVPAGTGHDDRSYWYMASGECNHLMIRTWVNAWRGYATINSMQSVRIPITAASTEAVEKDLLGTYTVEGTLTKFGTHFYGVDNFWANSDFDIFARYAHGQAIFADIYESYYSGGHYVPADYNQYWINGGPIGHGGGVVFVPVWITTQNWPYSFLMGGVWAWDYQDFSGNRIWQAGGLEGGFLSLGRKVVNFTSVEDGHTMKALIPWGGKIYCFHDSGPYYPYRPTVCRVYDFDSGDLLLLKEIHAWHYIDRVEIQSWNGRVVFVARFLDEWEDFGEDYYSDVTMLDAETLDVVGTVTIGQGSAVSYLTCPAPDDYMTMAINAVRSQQPAIYRSMPGLTPNYYYQPVSWLGCSAQLSAVAQAHISWCAANGRMSHEDADGNLVYARALPYGAMVAAENLAYTPQQTTIEAEIDAAIAGWLTSPSHKATMVQYEHLAVGWAAATVPASFATLTIGPGLWTGTEYTTEDTVIDIPAEQRGKIRLYCTVFAGG